MSSEYTKQVSRIQQLFYYPYACQRLVDAHSTCLSEKSWRDCETVRTAMDKCLDEGEKQRFHLHATCSRVKRLHQSCLMQNDSDCADQLAVLDACASAAAADFQGRRQLVPQQRPVTGVALRG